MKRKLLIIFTFIILTSSVIEGTSSSINGNIIGNSVNLRTNASFSAQVISILKPGTTVVILQMSDLWYHIRLLNGIEGWVYSQYITTHSNTIVKSRDRFSFLIPEMLDYAKCFMGATYVYGGDSPRGFDCSGFIMFVTAKFGVTLPHQADLQMEYGDSVESIAELIPGDLVFFRTYDSVVVNHVGIYLENGEFIHASSGRGYVTINQLNSGYYHDHYAGGRRLVKTE